MIAIEHTCLPNNPIVIEAICINMLLYEPIISLQAVSENCSPLPLISADFSSLYEILPERSRSTISNRRSVSGDTPGGCVGG